MKKIKWIGTSKFKEDIENLIANNDIVLIEFEYYVVLMRMIDKLKKLNLNYTTDLFEADSCLRRIHSTGIIMILKI